MVFGSFYLWCHDSGYDAAGVTSRLVVVVLLEYLVDWLCHAVYVGVLGVGG